MKRFILIAVSQILVLGCSNDSILPLGDWNPDVHAKISKMLTELGKESDTYDASMKPYAVFDFDNTSIINDVEMSLMYYQIMNLRYKLKPDEFFASVTGCLSDIDIPIYGNLSARMFAEDLTADYMFLYSSYISRFENPHTREAEAALSAIRNTDEYKDFAAKYVLFYQSVSQVYDYATDCIWIIEGLNGMTPKEIAALTKESCGYFTAMDGIREVTWESPCMGACGKISGIHFEGLSISDEMKNLYKILRAEGFAVYIVSASLEIIVEAMACDPDYGFNMDPECVFGLRMKDTADGIFHAEYSDFYIQTFKKGKTEAIKAYIAPSHGDKGPCLVAGDSNGDYDMLTAFDDMIVGLIINCGNTGNISDLASSGDPNIAVQDRDLARGRFISSHDPCQK